MQASATSVDTPKLPQLFVQSPAFSQLVGKIMGPEATQVPSLQRLRPIVLEALERAYAATDLKPGDLTWCEGPATQALERERLIDYLAGLTLRSPLCPDLTGAEPASLHRAVARVWRESELHKETLLNAIKWQESPWWMATQEAAKQWQTHVQKLFSVQKIDYSEDVAALHPLDCKHCATLSPDASAFGRLLVAQEASDEPDTAIMRMMLEPLYPLLTHLVTTSIDPDQIAAGLACLKTEEGQTACRLNSASIMAIQLELTLPPEEKLTNHLLDSPSCRALIGGRELPEHIVRAITLGCTKPSCPEEVLRLVRSDWWEACERAAAEFHALVKGGKATPIETPLADEAVAIAALFTSEELVDDSDHAMLLVHKMIQAQAPQLARILGEMLTPEQLTSAYEALTTKPGRELIFLWAFVQKVVGQALLTPSKKIESAEDFLASPDFEAIIDAFIKRSSAPFDQETLLVLARDCCKEPLEALVASGEATAYQVELTITQTLSMLCG